MAVKKNELYSSLWASCDKLRGGMDASQYKDYILTLLFVKYVTDRFKGERYADISVPDGGSFDDIVTLKGDKNIGEGIDKVIAKLAEANELQGVIDNAHFNDDKKLGNGQEMVDKLTGLVSIFQRPELDFKNNRASDDDIIGDAYEYLMRNFATESGKSKGQFYTPAEVSRVLAKVLGIGGITSSDIAVYDPACGSGSLLIRAANEAPLEVAIYGQEKDIATAGLAKMNLVLHNKASGVIIGNYSTFSDPKYFEDEETQTTLRRFDFIVANPPFSSKNWTDGLKEYGRFDGYGDRPPEKNGDYAWLLHILKSLKSNGKAAVILPHGVLFRGNAEGTIRQNIIDRGYIKGIIGLPANLFYGTGIPACVIVIDKENAASRQGIFMIDASRDFVKDGNKNRLRERDIYKIVKYFNEQIEEKGYSHFVPNDEIKKKNGYNLNIPRYIDGGEKEDLQNIDAHLNGGIPKVDIDGLECYWKIFGKLKTKLFAPFRPGFYRLKPGKEKVRDIIYTDEAFSRYANRIGDAFSKWQQHVDKSLRTIDRTVRPKTFIVMLAEKLLRCFESIELVDKYDVYQVLLAYWNETMADDVHVVVLDGYGAARETENIMGEYTSGKKKGQPKVIGWDGKLLPKTLLIDMFFVNEKKAITDAEIILADLESQRDAMIEEQTGEDGVLFEFLNDKDAVDDKRVESAAKPLRKKKSSLDDEENLLLQYANLVNKIKDHEKLIKGLKNALDDSVRAKYSKLTDNDILELLVNRKWHYTLFSGIDALYTEVSHRLANRILELAERYEEKLPDLEREVETYEAKVKSHLERMGFKW